MIDHVTIRVDDLGASRRFYDLALRILDAPEPTEGGGFVEWNDFSVAASQPDRPPTRRLHIGFRAASTTVVDEWWRAMTGAGHPDDGAPGPRPEYSPEYYGAFVRDPDGLSVEAVHNRPEAVQDGVLDHLWLRVRELEATTRFYEAVAPAVGYSVTRLRGRARIHGDGASFSVLDGDPSENVHIAFSAGDRETVRRFHEAGVTAGFLSLGEPGERPEYHEGYYGAYLADPDGNNIEAVFHDR